MLLEHLDDQPLFDGDSPMGCPSLALLITRKIVLDALPPGRRRIALTLRRHREDSDDSDRVVARHDAEFSVRSPLEEEVDVDGAIRTLDAAASLRESSTEASRVASGSVSHAPSRVLLP